VVELFALEVVVVVVIDLDLEGPEGSDNSGEHSSGIEVSGSLISD